jgi:hypothetical protein
LDVGNGVHILPWRVALLTKYERVNLVISIISVIAAISSIVTMILLS